MKEVSKNKMDISELQTIAQDVLQESLRCGADQAEVSVSINKGFSVSAHGGDVETVEYNQDRVLELMVYFGKRSGSSSFSDTRPEAIRSAVEAACHIARFTDEDPYAGLAEKNELAFQYPHIALYFPWALTVSQAIDLACQCEREALAQDKRIMSAEEVKVATSEAWHVHANTLGFSGYYGGTHHDVSCVLIAKEGEEMQRDYSYTLSCDPHLLESTSQVAKQAAQKVLKRLGARRLPTMKAPVIFSAEEARGLLGSFVAAIQGGSLYRKSSFLVDHLGKKIFPSHIHIAEQPHLAKALGSAPFDSDGVLTRNNVFIEEGILQQYALGVYSAKKLNLQTTGNAGGVHNLTIQVGKNNLAALLKVMNKGLLVTELMGNGVNLVTGDYSRGVGGYWVENGELQYPVQEITIAGNLRDIYGRILEVGNDIDVRGNIRTGSILIEEMMIAGD
jgi:PmbA protein